MNRDVEDFVRFIISEIEAIDPDDTESLKNVIGHVYDQALNIYAKYYKA